MKNNNKNKTPREIPEAKISLHYDTPFCSQKGAGTCTINTTRLFCGHWSGKVHSWYTRRVSVKATLALAEVVSLGELPIV